MASHLAGVTLEKNRFMDCFCSELLPDDVGDALRTRLTTDKYDMAACLKTLVLVEGFIL